MHRGHSTFLLPWQSGQGPTRPAPLQSLQTTLPGVELLEQFGQTQVAPVPLQLPHGVFVVVVSPPALLRLSILPEPPQRPQVPLRGTPPHVVHFTLPDPLHLAHLARPVRWQSSHKTCPLPRHKEHASPAPGPAPAGAGAAALASPGLIEAGVAGAAAGVGAGAPDLINAWSRRNVISVFSQSDERETARLNRLIASS